MKAFFAFENVYSNRISEKHKNKLQRQHFEESCPFLG